MHPHPKPHEQAAASLKATLELVHKRRVTPMSAWLSSGVSPVAGATEELQYDDEVSFVSLS